MTVLAHNVMGHLDRLHKKGCRSWQAAQSWVRSIILFFLRYDGFSEYYCFAWDKVRAILCFVLNLIDMFSIPKKRTGRAVEYERLRIATG